MAMMRREWLLGTGAALLCAADARAKPRPIRKTQRSKGWAKAEVELWLSERSEDVDGTVSVVAEATAGDEVVGLTVDILPGWTVVDPRMHRLTYAGQVRFRSLGERSDALVKHLAKVHRLNPSGALPMVAQRSLELTLYDHPPQAADYELRVGSRAGDPLRISVQVAWVTGLVSIAATDPQTLLDLLTRPV